MLPQGVPERQEGESGVYGLRGEAKAAMTRGAPVVLASHPQDDLDDTFHGAGAAVRAAIGDKFHTYRETVYLPDVDLVLFGMSFLNNKQVAYDPEKSRWVLTNIGKASRAAAYDVAKGQWSFAAPTDKNSVGSVTFSPVLDTKRNVLRAPSDYKSMYLLKLDPKTLVLSDDPAK